MDYKSAGLSDSEYKRINELLEREPNPLETQLIGVMWSEHCSYNRQKGFLRHTRQRGNTFSRDRGKMRALLIWERDGALHSK